MQVCKDFIVSIVTIKYQSKKQLLLHLAEEFAGQNVQFGEQTKDLIDTFVDRIMDEVNQEEAEKDNFG